MRYKAVHCGSDPLQLVEFQRALVRTVRLQATGVGLAGPGVQEDTAHSVRAFTGSVARRFPEEQGMGDETEPSNHIGAHSEDECADTALCEQGGITNKERRAMRVANRPFGYERRLAKPRAPRVQRTLDPILRVGLDPGFMTLTTWVMSQRAQKA